MEGIIKTIKEGVFASRDLTPQRYLQDKTDSCVIEATSGKDPLVRKAVKVYRNFRKQDGGFKTRIVAEIVCMKSISHPNVIKLEEAIYCTLDDTISLITPLYDQGTLLQLLREKELDNLSIWRIFIEIGCAVRHLHKRRIVHGDIKPANIFISETGSAVLADFDQARSLGDQKSLTSWGGSRNFVGPEYYRDGCQVNPYLMDAYALGATVFAMYFFHSGPLKNGFNLEHHSASLLEKPENQQPRRYHLLLAMNRLVRTDPSRRKSVTRVLKDVPFPEMTRRINGL